MRKWTIEEKNILMANAGKTRHEIAALLKGRNADGVSKMAFYLNIPLKVTRVEPKGDIYFNGSPCLMFMSLEQMCRTKDVTFRSR